MRLVDVCDFLDTKGINYSLIGNKAFDIRGFSPLNEYAHNTITWVRGKGEGYKQVELDCAVVRPECELTVYNRIECDNPKEVFYSIMEQFFYKMESYKSKDYYVSSQVKLGKYVIIGDGSRLIGDIKIGDGTVIGYGVSIIGKVDIGCDCIIKSGVIIGEEDIDFYYGNDGKRHVKKQYGSVKIGNSTIVGPNSVINRGALGNTIIGDNVIIDALCMISHNVRIGDNTVIITGCSLFGSVSIGANCYISTSIIRNQVTIGDNVQIGMGSTVLKDLSDNVVAFGSPAEIVKQKR